MTYPDGRHNSPAPHVSDQDKAYMRDYLASDRHAVPGTGHIPRPRHGESGPAAGDWAAATAARPTTEAAPAPAQSWTSPAANPRQDGIDDAAQQRYQAAYQADRSGLPSLARGRAVDRLITVGGFHAGHAADLVRTRDDLCEHALAQVSIGLSDETFPISVSTKLSHSDESNADLRQLLASMIRFVKAKTAEAYAAGEHYDPRTAVVNGPGMANRSEVLHPAMTYVGVGVSTLDTPELPWQQMKTSVRRGDGLHLRSQGYLYLADGTFCRFLRAAQHGPQAGQHQILANSTVHSSRYRVERDFELWTVSDQYTRQIWQGLEELHRALTAASIR